MLDLDHGDSGVIGDRAFHRDPRVVALLAKSLMHGLLQAGMHNCGKHFPGHGFVAADSHVEIPVDDAAARARSSPTTRGRTSGSPARWPSVMPAHVIYPQRRRAAGGLLGALAAATSCAIELGFDGAIFSDDLSMAGARRVGGVEVSYAEAAALALARRLRHGAAVQPVASTAARPSTPCSTACSRARAGGQLAGRSPTAKRAASTCCRRPRRSPGTS